MKQLNALGKISYEEKLVLSFCKLQNIISRSYLLESIIPGIDDTIIAMIGATNNIFNLS